MKDIMALLGCSESRAWENASATSEAAIEKC